jgi:hypothetical protein
MARPRRSARLLYVVEAKRRVERVGKDSSSQIEEKMMLH